MKRIAPLLLLLAALLPADARPRKVIVRSGACGLDGRRYNVGDRARRLKNNALVQCLPNGKWERVQQP